MKRTLLVAVLAAALTGCATAPQVMTQNKYVPTLSWPDKETAWTTYSTKQINDNTTCNKNTDLLIQWDAQQNALYNGASAPGAASAPGGAK
jgi:opacity protein-like surface antigen